VAVDHSMVYRRRGVFFSTCLKGLSQLAGGRLGFCFLFSLKVELCDTENEFLQGWLIDLFGLVNVDSTPYIPVEAGVEETGRIFQRAPRAKVILTTCL
jgi:hypothetical protein